MSNHSLVIFVFVIVLMLLIAIQYVERTILRHEKHDHQVVIFVHPAIYWSAYVFLMLAIIASIYSGPIKHWW